MEQPLTRLQLTSLFDILTHAETASEVESFKHPSAIANYGPPFSLPDDPVPAVTSPLLQTLLLRLVLPAPGICDLPPEFWGSVQGILAGLASSGLSESYDKGSVGTRRTLGAGASAVFEGLARGCLGGYPRSGLLSGVNGSGENGQDCGGEEERLEAGWDEFVRGVVHGDLVDDVCEWLEGTDDLEGYSPVVDAAAEYAIINFASLLHHIFAVTPEGQYLLKLIQNAHKLIPYAMIGQILRLGNAATMLNSLLKLLLAKFGLATISNWAGFTQGADEGMNLLQRIISGVLYWDSYEFKKTCDKIEKGKNAPSSKHLKALRKHVQGPKERREELRKSSIENSKSIILTILDETDPKLSQSLSEEQHEQCLQYYAAILSTRDRDEIINVFCRSNPDLLTQAVRDLVGVYEPMIRDIHATIDLTEHLDNTRAFIDDFLAVSASKEVDGAEGEEDGYSLPTVGDYVELLRRHRGSVYSWLHQASSKCPQVRDQVRDWAKGTVRAFQPEESPGNIDGSTLLDRLEVLFAALPGEKQDEIRKVLDQHAIYLAALETGSRGRAEAIAQNGAGSAGGPGIYLSSWQSILDSTPITPDAKGGARTGEDVLDRTTPGKPGLTGDISWDGAVDARGAMEVVEMEEALRPDGDVVVGALGEGFYALLKEVAMITAGMDIAGRKGK